MKTKEEIIRELRLTVGEYQRLGFKEVISDYGKYLTYKMEVLNEVLEEDVPHELQDFFVEFKK